MSDMDLLFNQVASLEKLKLERDRDAAAASVRRRELEEQLSDGMFQHRYGKISDVTVLQRSESLQRPKSLSRSRGRRPRV